MSRGAYNIKFNRAMYRRLVIRQWWEWVIASTVTAGPAGFALYACLAWGWPQWPVVLTWILFLFCFVCGLYIATSGTMDYRRIHVRGKTRKGKATSA